MDSDIKPAFIYLREGFEKLERQRQAREKACYEIIELNDDKMEVTALDYFKKHYAKQSERQE